MKILPYNEKILNSVQKALDRLTNAHEKRQVVVHTQRSANPNSIPRPMRKLLKVAHKKHNFASGNITTSFYPHFGESSDSDSSHFHIADLLPCYWAFQNIQCLGMSLPYLKV